MTATTASATCLLLVGDRVVLRAIGPPEAEYAMFEIGEIELRASEPGRVREHGYQTTAEQARARLAHLGITAAMARELADAMQPVLSDAYARGGAVRRVARYLGPLELFQSDGYDGAQHAYRGVFLDLAAFARDLALDHARTTLHALYLAMVLEGESDETKVLLSTDACTKGGKPGARTYKRPSFAERQRLLNAVGGLAHKSPRPDIHDALPRADVIAFLRARADIANDEDSRALYRSLEGTVALRDMPEKGPLASPDLWAIETRIEGGDLEGTLDAIDDAERRHGRTPGTTYLRARVSLLMRLEPPKFIAERVSALALSMTSFQELALLATEAWLDAGEPRRAMPYARDLVDSPGVDEGLLLRAQRLLARSVGAAPQKKQTMVDVAAVGPQPSRPPAGALEPPITLDEEFPSFAIPPEAPASDTLPQSLEPEDLVPALLTPPPPLRVAGSSLPPVSPPARPLRGVPPPVPSSRPSSPLRAPPPSSRKLPTGGLASGGGLANEPPRMPGAPILTPPDLPEGEPSVRLPAGLEFSGQVSLGEFSLDDAPIVDPLATRDPSETREPPKGRPSSIPPVRSKRPQRADVLPQALPRIDLDLTPVDSAASFTLDLPGPEALPPSSGPSEAKPSRRPKMSGVMMETRPPTSYDPRAEPDGPMVPRADASLEGNPVRHPSPVPEARPAPARRASAPSTAETETTDRTAHERPTPMRPPSSEPRLSNRPPAASSARDSESPRARQNANTEPPPAEIVVAKSGTPNAFMHGASLPPYRHENPAPLLPRAPLLPKLGGNSDELAEHLALPPGLGGEQRSLDVLPTSVLEARVQFTLLSRELGLDFRLKRGIDLRADVSGIEAMQSVLLESFPDHAVRTSDEAYELRRHGALLSEILARRLDAEWLDISPNELGYWVMIVPPDTRVWPFGRVARLVAMGHKERDLVSYFFELQSRARGR